MPYKVFIVDDHSIFRNGLKMLLNEIPAVEVAGEASNGREFLKKIKDDPPSIVFMDIQMPEMNGIDATRIAASIYSNMKIIALSMYDDYEYLEEIMEAGAKGYILKNIGKSELSKAIKNLSEGKSFFCNNSIKVLANHVKTSNQNTEYQKVKKSLSKRESVILELICKGLSTRQISEKLSISPRTVDGHRNNMLKKTGFKNTPALVSYAIKNKLIKQTV